MRSRSIFLAAAAFAALVGALPVPASAQTVQRAYASNPGGPNSFNSNELVESGHQFFGSASRGRRIRNGSSPLSKGRARSVNNSVP